MKKMINLLLLLVLLAGCQKEKVCNVNEGMICFDEEINQYQIEENASLVVAVDNEAYGQALQALWDKTHPDHPGVVEYVVQTSFDGAAFLNGQPDLGLIWANEAARLDSWFYPIEWFVQEEIDSTLLPQYGASVNKNQFVYTPMFGYGWVFSTNRTLLNELGLSVSDENEDGLVDAMDTFEEITAWADSLQKPLEVFDKNVTNIFSLNFEDPFEAMVTLTAGDFIPFETFKAEEPGFGNESFLSTLMALAELGKHQWQLPEEIQEEAAEGSEEENKEEADLIRQQQSTRAAEFYLSEASSVFSMVGSWMYYEEFESLTGQDFSFSPMPTWMEKTMHPYTLSAGYIINKNTAYPNSCFELLRLIRSDEGLQAFVETSDYPLLYNYLEEREPAEQEEQGSPLPLNFASENLAQISYAMMQGQEESMVAFELEPTVRGWAMFTELEIYSIFKDVFEQKVTPEQAQQAIVEAAEIWMAPYLPQEENQEENE